MNKYIKAVLAVVGLLISVPSMSEVRFSQNEAKEVYQAEINSETFISELKIGSTGFTEYSLQGCLESNSLMLIDQKIILKWPDGKYDSTAWAIKRVSEDQVAMSLEINKGSVDGANIPGQFTRLFRVFDCDAIYTKVPYHQVRKLFSVKSIEGLTEISDILERAVHLSKIYAK